MISALVWRLGEKRHLRRPRGDAIFLDESLLKERKSSRALILSELVPQVFEFRPADWPEKEEDLNCRNKENNSALGFHY